MTGHASEEGGHKANVDDYDPAVKPRSLDHREHYFSPLQGLQTDLKLDAEDLYRLSGGEQGGRKSQAADFRKDGGMHWQEGNLVGESINRLNQEAYLDG